VDILSHGLWGAIVFGRKNKKSFWKSFLWGVMPDLLSFGIFTPLAFFGFVESVNWHEGPPSPDQIPQFVHTLYNLTHSFVIFALVFGIVFYFTKKPSSGRKAVNYNRDVEAFEILESLGKRIVSENNFIHSYRSPTDMGINMAGFCIKDDKICGEAAIKEIENRLKGYENLLTIGKGKAEWVSRTQDILLKAKSNL
jgi:hypothetical protein